jgi:outer membrane protein assembly factor BamB
MSAPTATETKPQRPPARYLRALLVYLAVAALGVAGLWLWPSDGSGRDMRTMITQSVAILTALVLLGWWGLYSGFPARLRIGVPVLLLGAAAASVRSAGCTGDMRLLLSFRWEPSHYDALEAQRRAQRAEGAAPDLAALADESPADYPEYRNRARDGVAHGQALARDWKVRPPRLVWKQLCGGGYAGFAVARGRAVTIEQRRDNEVVACYDAATGRELWTHSYPARFYDARGGEGPMATPTISADAVYALGGTGKLSCLDLGRGAVRWQVNILEDNNNLTWGMAGSPLAYGGVVVVNPGDQRGRADGRTLAAYDCKTGERVWGAGNTRAGYSSPMRATLAGVDQVVLFDGQEIAGYDEGGKGKLWSLPYPTKFGINVAEPLVVGDDRLFISAGYDAGCGLLKVARDGDKWSAAEAGYWGKKTMRCKFTSPVLHKGLVYGLDEGVLACVDPADGRQVWKGKRYGHGQLLRSDDLLLIQAESGELALVEAAGDRTRELGRVRALAGDKTWNCPALAGGRAYVRNHEEMACYDLSEGGAQ